MGDLSRNFSRHEFRDRRTGEVDVDPALIEALERLRAICGNRPMRIVSGYRSPSTNRAVGGAKRSQHLRGRAADLEPGYATEAQARRAGFRGIGLAGASAIHVDVRRRIGVAIWRYR